MEILQRIIATNYYLSKLTLKDTQYCTFCKVKIETNEHFKECSNVTEIEWAVVLSKFNVPITIDKMSLCFSKFNFIMYKIHNL